MSTTKNNLVPKAFPFFRENQKRLGDEVAKNISFVSSRFILGVWIKCFISEIIPGPRKTAIVFIGNITCFWDSFLLEI